MSKNYITPGGAQKLRSELQELLYTERPKLVETVAWAASNGDRSENGDYIYGKKRLREIDRRIRFLTKRLEAAEVVDPAKQNSQQILFGATVTVETEDGDEIIYQIVGLDETNPSNGQISWKSPIAKALLGNSVGDTVRVRLPVNSKTQRSSQSNNEADTIEDSENERFRIQELEIIDLKYE